VRDEFSETLRVAAPPDAVWRAVGEIPAVLGWISIVSSVAEVEPGERYSVVLEDRLGPFKLRADLDVVVRERVEGTRIGAHGDGEDRQVGSRLVVDVLLELAESDGGTEVRLKGSYEVTGRPASLGAGSIRKKAGKILAEFFARAEQAAADAVRPG
jgi:carbon monoxide dehydrogenase subunit G